VRTESFEIQKFIDGRFVESMAVDEQQRNTPILSHLLFIGKMAG
jgi:hypothetical protein